MKQNLFILLFFILSTTFSQSEFSSDEYELFLLKNKDLSPLVFVEESEPTIPYCNDIIDGPDITKTPYLDSFQIKLGLSGDEKSLIEKNQFMVTERLSYSNFGDAFHDVYKNDLPVFITTDAILHALHKSYDEILITLEREMMSVNLEWTVKKMYNGFNTAFLSYHSDPNAQQSLEDLDIFTTIAYSLIKDTLKDPQLVTKDKVQNIWDKIKEEKASTVQLFSDRNRNIDFSQFKPRGHYVYEGEGTNLEPYFRCMMWLGRIEIFLTPPPKNPWELPWTKEEIQRMIQSAIMINEVVNNTGADTYINKNDEIINYLVGESDNVTPAQLTDILASFSITSATDIYKDGVYESFQTHLKNSDEYQQKILSEIIMVDPYNATPDTISVVYKVMGQRFILDSYILGNVIYDKIIYNGEKIKRLMPDPLDAMYVLGNDNGALLMKDEIDEYKYASNLKALRYLVNSYDEGFWNETLYSIWLSALRELNPGKINSGIPFFMQTNAWQHEKLNTQLASWSQLRHDNLLYAKPSYTPGIGCSYPYSYVEPYPEMYKKISEFANGAAGFFAGLGIKSYNQEIIVSYFTRLDTICLKLKELSEKELHSEAFNEDDKIFLSNMLYLNIYPSPKYTGWYSLLFFIPDDVANNDYIIADIHTQPTDEVGAPVGKVLHAATGKINLGVFLCPVAENSNEYMAFTGPVMSYYQTITKDFYRYTDQEWEEMVDTNLVPERPDWVNIYLASDDGLMLKKGRELPGISYNYNEGVNVRYNNKMSENIYVYPNPVKDVVYIECADRSSKIYDAVLYDIQGKVIKEIKNNKSEILKFNISDLNNGIYFVRINTSVGQLVEKIVR